MVEAEARRARRGPAADDRRGDPGARRDRARRGRPDLPAQGRHRARARPAQRRDPRAGQLAARERQRPGGAPAYARQNRAVAASYEPGSTFKAFTVAGALEEKADRAGHALRPAADDPGGRPRDQGGARPRLRVAHDVGQILAQSSNVGSVKIGLKLGARKRFDKWVRRFGFGPPTGVELPGEQQGIVPAPRELLGLLDRQPADRAGPGGHPDADGRRLPGDRQRRRDAHAAHRRWATAPPPARALEETADEVSRCSRACSAPAAPRRRPRSRATSSPARPAPRRSRRVRRLLEDQVRRLVHRLRAGAQPAAAGGRDGRRAPGRDLRRHVAAPAFEKIAEFALPYLGIPPDESSRSVNVRLLAERRAAPIAHRRVHGPRARSPSAVDGDCRVLERGQPRLITWPPVLGPRAPCRQRALHDPPMIVRSLASRGRPHPGRSVSRSEPPASSSARRHRGGRTDHPRGAPAPTGPGLQVERPRLGRRHRRAAGGGRAAWFEARGITARWPAPRTDRPRAWAECRAQPLGRSPIEREACAHRRVDRRQSVHAR